MERARHEVWAKVVWAAVDTAERGGLSLDGLFDGLPFDASSILRARRVAWADYCTVIERIEERAGSPEACAALYDAEYHQSFPEVRAVVSAIVDPKVLLRSSVVASMVLFPPIEMVVHDAGVDRARVEIRLREGARPCLAFFRGTAGTIAGMPRYLGLPSSRVEVEASGHYGVYHVLLPPSQTLLARGRRLLGRRTFAPRFVLGIDEDGSQVTTTIGAPENPDISARLIAAIEAWELTRRQGDVLGVLARGKSNKEIAVELGCAENTVELHVTQLLRRTGASSRGELIARFWSEL